MREFVPIGTPTVGKAPKKGLCHRGQSLQQETELWCPRPEQPYNNALPEKQT